MNYNNNEPPRTECVVGGGTSTYFVSIVIKTKKRTEAAARNAAPCWPTGEAGAFLYIDKNKKVIIIYNVTGISFSPFLPFIWLRRLSASSLGSAGRFF